MDIYLGKLLDDEYGRGPLTLVDVGARGGLQANWRPAMEHLRLIGFEPDPDEYARLAAKTDAARTLYINAAVAREPGRATINIGRSPGTSSLLVPNMSFLRRFPRADRFETVRQVTVETDSLDRLLPAHGVRDPDFLKLDTQGAELSILEGARDTLAHALFGVEVEIQLGALYVDQPSIGAIDDCLRGAGFQLFDLRPSYWKRAAGVPYGGPKGQLVFADGLYLRTEESFRRALEHSAADVRASKLLRALAICRLYGYLDYAIELFEPHRRLFEDNKAAAIAAALRSDVRLSTRLPHFKGRGWISHACYRLHRAFFPTFEGWASGGRHLGNAE